MRKLKENWLFLVIGIFIGSFVPRFRSTVTIPEWVSWFFITVPFVFLGIWWIYSDYKIKRKRNEFK